MTAHEFCKLSPIEMQIEVLETEAYNFACDAKNEFTKSGNSQKYEMLQRQSHIKLDELKTLKTN